MYFRGNFDALRCVGRGRTKETEEGDDICRRARQSIIAAMRNETNDIVPSLPPLSSLSLFLWTHFSAPISLGPAMINEGIRGMLLNSFDI